MDDDKITIHIRIHNPVWVKEDPKRNNKSIRVTSLLANTSSFDRVEWIKKNYNLKTTVPIENGTVSNVYDNLPPYSQDPNYAYNKYVAYISHTPHTSEQIIINLLMVSAVCPGGNVAEGLVCDL